MLLKGKRPIGTVDCGMQTIWFTLLCSVGLGREGAAAQRTDHFVQSHPGIRIYIRKVVDRDNTSGLPVLLMHGGSPPGEVVFDLSVPGYSLAEDLAKAGHLVYIVDVRGWGKSTWPALMDSADPHAPQAVTSSEALEDISAAVDWIKADSGRKRVALLGHATGGHWGGMVHRWAQRERQSADHGEQHVRRERAVGAQLRLPESPRRYSIRSLSRRILRRGRCLFARRLESRDSHGRQDDLARPARGGRLRSRWPCERSTVTFSHATRDEDSRRVS